MEAAIDYAEAFRGAKDLVKLAKLTNKQLRAELEAEKATAEAERLKDAMEEKERNLNTQFDALNTARVRSTKLTQFVDRFQSGKVGSTINLHGPVRWFNRHSFIGLSSRAIETPDRTCVLARAICSTRTAP